MKSIALNKFAIVFALGIFSALLLNVWIVLHVLKLHRQTLAEQQNRQEVLRISADIQMETASLSRMVRAYTTLADTRYLNYYYDIIDIRSGRKPHPEGYGPTYWAEVMAGVRPHVMPRDWAGRTIQERMRAQWFSTEEFEAVDRILARSMALFEQDQIAFAATQGLYDPISQTFTDEGRPHLSFANQFVYSNAYLILENDLLQEVESFARMTSERTQAAVEQVSARLSRSITVAIAILIATLGLVLIAMDVIRRRVLAPMQALSGAAAALGAGDYSIRTDTAAGVFELQALGMTFNTMADNIQEDITRRERTQQELEIASCKAEESTRAKSMFLANMSHEIRTPMNAIIGMTYLILNTELDRRQQDYVDKIQGAAQSLLRIINDILDFSKIEAGKLELELVDFILEDTVGNAVNLLRQQALDKGIELLLDIADPRLTGQEGVFRGDPLRLEQIFANLLTNAVKFTDQGHVLFRIEEISRTPTASVLRCTVEDTGIGMTGKQMERLFQEFSQADGSTTRRHGGTGLGLSITKRLLLLMGGEITVESQTGQGTRFSCTVPLERVVRREVGAAPRLLGWPLKALIVEDHEPARLVLHTLLGHFGVESTAVASGPEALRLLGRDEAAFDLVFVDWVMPEMDGAALIAAIRDLPGSERLTIVVVSAFAEEMSAEFRQQNEYCHFLAKPVLPGDLRRLFDEMGLERADGQAGSQAGLVLPRLQGMRVLLAEDNLVNQQIAAEMLAYHGARVDIANNGREALDMLGSASDHAYHAILMDIQMPVLDGYETTSLIRAQPRYADLPIIAMTAHAMVEEKERCRVLGMSAHLTKPFIMEDLLATLSSFHDRKRGKIADPGLLSAEADQKRAEHSAPPGIDLAKGLAQCAGDRGLYRRIVGRYIDEFTNISISLRAHLDGERWPELAGLAHTFKGLSGTVGAGGLHSLGQKIEQAAALRSADLPDLIDELAHQAPATFTYLRRHCEDGAETSTVRPGDLLGAEAGAVLFASLRVLLGESDSAAIDFWKEHETALRRALTPISARKLDQAINAFRFDEALAQLDTGRKDDGPGSVAVGTALFPPAESSTGLAGEAIPEGDHRP